MYNQGSDFTVNDDNTTSIRYYNDETGQFDLWETVGSAALPSGDYYRIDPLTVGVATFTGGTYGFHNEQTSGSVTLDYVQINGTGSATGLYNESGTVTYIQRENALIDSVLGTQVNVRSGSVTLNGTTEDGHNLVSNKITVQNGATLKVTDSTITVNENLPLTVNTGATVQLYGVNVDGTGVGAGNPAIDNYGTLTIGKATAANTGLSASVMDATNAVSTVSGVGFGIENNNRLTLEDGTTVSASAGWAVKNRANGNLTLRNGVVLYGGGTVVATGVANAGSAGGALWNQGIVRGLRGYRSAESRA